MQESIGIGASAERQQMLSPMSRMSRGGGVNQQQHNNYNSLNQGHVVDKEKELIIKELQLENAELKTIVEQMKEDMERVVQEVKAGRIGGGGANQGNNYGNIVMQQEIIQKERKIFELERKLKQKEDELERLKEERDRLVNISNELRADLNNAQRQL